MPPQSSSQFRRTGQRDDRRRRLLADECLTAGEQPPAWSAYAEGAPERRSAHYGDAAFLDEQLRLYDLIPRRLGTLAGLWLVAAVALAALGLAYAWLPQWVPGVRTPVALDLAARGSLAGWGSSLLVLAAAVVALVVYTIRRHRTDDYHGRYRVWLWTVLCLVLFAADQATGLHQGFQQLMVHWTGTRLLGDGSLWWIIPYLFLLGAIGSRLLVDMTECRLSTAVLLAAAGCYAVALAARFGWLVPEDGTHRVLLAVGTKMGGNLCLLLALGLHARHVLLDAEGLLPRPEPAAAEPCQDELDEEAVAPAGLPIAVGGTTAGQPRRTIDSPHSTPPPTFSPPAAKPLGSASARSSSTPAASEAASTSGYAAIGRKLTKAEKKALRHRLEQERLKRQAQQHSAWGK